jgi:hypothetical protein
MPMLGLTLQRGSEGETSLMKAGWMAGVDAPMYEYAKKLQQPEPEGVDLTELGWPPWRARPGELVGRVIADSMMKEWERRRYGKAERD